MNRKIKARMILKGITTVAIAREAGVSRTWVSLVLNGHSKSARIRKLIAARLDASVRELWPNGNGEAA